MHFKSNGFHSLTIRLLAVLILISVSGCATFKPMALNDKTVSLDTSTESIALITVKTSNTFKPSYLPVLYYVRILDDNGAAYAYRVLKPYRKTPLESCEHLVSLSLEPGKYVLESMNGISEKFLMRGQFFYEFKIPFEIQPRSIQYLGHIDMVNRKRKEGEVRAGAVIPLIDQAVTGFAGGTFDVTYSNRFDEDMAIFRENYPALNDHEVGIALISK